MSRCENIIDDLPDELFDNDEKKKIFEQLKAAAKSPGGREKLSQIKAEIAESKSQAINESKRKRYMNIIHVANMIDHANRFADPSRGLISYLTGIFSDVKETGFSVDAIKKATRAIFLKRLYRKLKEQGLYEYFMDKNNAEEIAKAMFNPEDTQDPQIREIARSLKQVQKDQVHMLNNRGANIQERSDYIAPQSHDPEKMMQVADGYADRIQITREVTRKNGGWKNYKAIRKELHEIAYKRWQDSILPLLDKEQTFKGRDQETFLREAYNTLVKGKADDSDLISGHKNPGFVSKMEQQRVLHFKDGQSWSAYNDMYGSGNVTQAIVNNIMRNADMIGIMDRMGTNPDLVYNTVRKKLIDQSDDPKIGKQMNKVDKYFTTVLDRDHIAVNHLWANMSTAFRSMTSMAKLGGVVIRSIPDLVEELAALRSNGIGYLDRWSIIMKQLLSPLTKSQQNELADSLGVMSESMFGHFNNRFGAVDSPRGFLSKAMGIYFKYNLQEAWDRSLRLGFATAIGRNLAYLRDSSFENLAPDLQRTLRRYGLEEKEWDLIRNSREGMKNAKGKLFVTPELSHSLDDQALADYLGKDVSKISPSERKMVEEQMEWKLQTYFMDQTDLSQLQPGASERAMLLRGTQRGTIAGELLRFIAQFKHYSLAVTRRALGRIAMEGGSDGFLQAIVQGKLSGRALLEYSANAIIFGYVSNALYSFLKTGSIPNPASVKTMAEAYGAGGGAGIYADYLFGQYNKFGRGLLETAAGPSLGTLNDMANLFATLHDFSNEGHRLTYHQRALKHIVQFANHDVIPHTFYTDMAWKYAHLNHLMDKIDPGYVHRHQQNVDRQNQQEGNIQIF